VVVQIDPIMVFDAILTGGRGGRGLQCFYGKPMAGDFLQNEFYTVCGPQCWNARWRILFTKFEGCSLAGGRSFDFF